jgi:hypothetical protein
MGAYLLIAVLVLMFVVSWASRRFAPRRRPDRSDPSTADRRD